MWNTKIPLEPVFGKMEAVVKPQEEGGRVILQCLVCGNPKPHIDRVRWTFDGGELPTGAIARDDRIIINDVKGRHYGRYQCSLPNNVIIPDKPEVSFAVHLATKG